MYSTLLHLLLVMYSTCSHTSACQLKCFESFVFDIQDTVLDYAVSFDSGFLYIEMARVESHISGENQPKEP